MSFFHLFQSYFAAYFFLAIFNPCLLKRRPVYQFPTAAAGMNHLRKANKFSDCFTNLEWVIFYMQTTHLWCLFQTQSLTCLVWVKVVRGFVSSWPGFSEWERGHVRGKSEREDTGAGMLSSGFQLRTTGSLSQARQANHPLQSGSSGPDILSGWMERPRGGQSLLLLQLVHRNTSSLLFSSHPIPPTFASFRSDFPFKYLFLPPLFVRALVVVPVVW